MICHLPLKEVQSDSSQKMNCNLVNTNHKKIRLMSKETFKCQVLNRVSQIENKNSVFM